MKRQSVFAMNIGFCVEKHAHIAAATAAADIIAVIHPAPIIHSFSFSLSVVTYGSEQKARTRKSLDEWTK